MTPTHHARLKIMLLCLLWGIPPSHATEDPDPLNIELKTEVPSLVASPELCEFKKGQSLCQMDATLLWETPKAGHYCVWDSEHPTPLQCWKNSWSGTYSLHFSAGKNREFWLTEGVEGGIAASTTIAVTNALEQRLRAKRRRGFWRVF